MRHKVPGILLLAFGLFLTVPTFAHHAFSVEYDGTKCGNMTGTFTKLDWENPHVYFYVDVKDDSGHVTPWSFETVSIAYLKRSGIQRQTFLDNVGKVVTVRACLGKSGANRAAAETFKMADGRTLKVGADYEHGSESN